MDVGLEEVEAIAPGLSQNFVLKQVKEYETGLILIEN